MERGKEEVIPIDKKTMEKIGKQILNHSEFKSIELQERIDKALEYIWQNSCLDEYNGNIVENYKYELENILKGEDK